MGFILLTIIAILLVYVIFWGFSLWESVQRDKSEAKQASVEAKLATERLAKDNLRYTPGVALICLDCNHRFSGPLTDSGCPNCHREALVVLATETPETGQSERSGNIGS
jgi:hypothetical protein